MRLLFLYIGISFVLIPLYKIILDNLIDTDYNVIKEAEDILKNINGDGYDRTN